MNQQAGKYIIIAGAIIIVIGLVIYFFHGAFKWIGRLPGDIRVQRENFSFYFPVTTMIIFSLLATIIIYLIRKFS